jgi:hypothetical protein
MAREARARESLDGYTMTRLIPLDAVALREVEAVGDARALPVALPLAAPEAEREGVPLPQPLRLPETLGEAVREARLALAPREALMGSPSFIQPGSGRRR